MSKQPMGKKQKLATICICSFAALCLLLLAAALLLRHFTPEEPGYTLADSAYTKQLSAATSVKEPLLPTTIDGVYYAASLTGDFAFYTIEDGRPAAYTGKVTSLPVTVTCSRQKLAATVYYIQQNNTLFGVGLYTGAKTDLIPYALFVLRNKPAAYAGDALLLISFEEDAFFAFDKVFSEMYAVNMPGGATSLLVANSTRTVTDDGVFRDDWVVLTHAFLDSVNSGYFLSSRRYTLAQKGQVCDVLQVREHIADLPRVITGALGLWVREGDGGLYYLKSTAGGFASVHKKGKTETVLRTFEGDFLQTYVQFGDYVFNKKTGILSHVTKDTDCDLALFADAQFSLETVSVSADNRYAALFFENETARNSTQPAPQDSPRDSAQTIVFADLQTGAFCTVAEPVLYTPDLPDGFWTADATFAHYRPENEDGTGLALCTVDVKALLESRTQPAGDF